MIALPTFTALRVEDYRLFPGSPRGTGIDFRFQEGASLIAGINGLGKTTLVTLLFRLLVGPFELPKDDAGRSFGANARVDVVPWTGRRRFFSQRVADRAKSATAKLTFTLAGRELTVLRALDTCRLLHADLDGAPLPITAGETNYQAALVALSGVGNFADFLTLAKYLIFFNEDRRNVLWDTQAQRQFYRMLFLTAEDSREWSALERQIGKFDSDARNASAAAYKLQTELDRMEAALLANAGVGEQLSLERTLLAADEARKAELESQLAEADDQLKEVRREVERSKIFEDEAERELEGLRYSALNRLFPQLDETATYVLTHLFSEGRCLACEADAPDERRRFEHALASGDCMVCGAGPARQRRIEASEAIAPATEVERRRLDRAREGVERARTKRLADAEEEERLLTVRRRTLDELAQVATAVLTRQVDIERLRAKLPPAPEELEVRRSAIQTMKAEQERLEAGRALAEDKYGDLIERLRDTIRAATEDISLRFSALATQFLEEECSLTFQMVTARPSQNGESFEYPALKFEMTAAAFEGRQIRETPTDVSESQREFIDLAFRMALMIVATRDGAGTLVMETPEASLDEVFMSRAADLLTSFGCMGRRVILTSNLTNSALIPALMGGPLAKGQSPAPRWARVLNLLEIAEENAALRNHRKRYMATLEAGIEGRDAA